MHKVRFTQEEWDDIIGEVRAEADHLSGSGDEEYWLGLAQRLERKAREEHGYESDPMMAAWQSWHAHHTGSPTWSAFQAGWSMAIDEAILRNAQLCQGNGKSSDTQLMLRRLK